MEQAYRLEGLDCASCAADIEGELRKEEGLEESRVNFAAGTVRLNPVFAPKARSVLKKVNPELRLASLGSSATEGGTAAGSAASAAMGNIREETSRAASLVERLRGVVSGRAANPLRILIGFCMFAAGLIVPESLVLPGGSQVKDLLLLMSWLLAGWPVLRGAFRYLLRGKLFNELFLMSAASIAAIIIGEIPEAAAVMLFYAVGEEMQERAVGKSRKAIKSMMALRPDTARLLSAGVTQLVKPEDVAVGDIVEVHAGELVPLDGEIIDGDSWMDTSALTGEAVPRRAGPGSAVSAGYINGEARIRIRVIAVFAESSAARLLDLIENAAARKSSTEKFISRFAAVYTPLVVFGALSVALVPPLFIAASWDTWIYRAMVLLVISCPCALVVSVPLGYFAAIGRASAIKVLVKGANVFDALTRVKTLVFDKTGTLSEGRFRVRGIYPADGIDSQELLHDAAAAESYSSHPIALSIRKEWGKKSDSEQAGNGPSDSCSTDRYREIRGMGIEANTGDRRILAGSRRLLEQYGIAVPQLNVNGTVVHIASDDSYSGYIILDDAIKKDSLPAVVELRQLGVERLILLTGDSPSRAAELGQALNIDEIHSSLLPEDKVSHLEILMKQSEKRALTAFAGDGLNDAPVIMRADVGIAMGGIGRDAAIEASDVVLMDDSPLRIPAAIRLARRTRRIVLQNIVFALGIKAIFIAAGVSGAASMWAAVFADVGVTLLAVLNSMRLLGYGVNQRD